MKVTKLNSKASAFALQYPERLLKNNIFLTSNDMVYFTKNYSFEETDELIEEMKSSFNYLKKITSIQFDNDKSLLSIQLKSKKTFTYPMAYIIGHLNSLGDSYAKSFADNLLKVGQIQNMILSYKIQNSDSIYYEIKRKEFELKNEMFYLENNNKFYTICNYEMDNETKNNSLTSLSLSLPMIQLKYGFIENVQEEILENGIMNSHYHIDNYFNYISETTYQYFLNEFSPLNERRDGMRVQVVTVDGLSFFANLRHTINMYHGKDKLEICIFNVLDIHPSIIEQISGIRSKRSTESNILNNQEYSKKLIKRFLVPK